MLNETMHKQVEYALRHLSQHTGEINALLRQAGAEVGSWL